MAKRFTATDKWKDSWFFDLDPKQKLFWLYLLDDCDCAGIWEKNFKTASIFLRHKVTEEWAIKFLLDRIFEFQSSKWFIPKFIEFQYGELSETSNPHKSVIRSLSKYNLYEGYLKGIYTLKDKEQDTDQDKDKDQEQTEPVTQKSNPLQFKTFEGRILQKDFTKTVYEKWNTFAKAHGLIESSRPTAARDQGIMERIYTGDIDLDAVIREIPNCPWLMNQVPGKSFRASLDFILDGDHAIKIVEGFYNTQDADQQADAAADQAVREIQRRRREKESR